MDDIMDILDQREATHGSYADTAEVAQLLKLVIHRDPCQPKSFPHYESLDMIATKMARILTGDANEPEHWLDIEGYARLARLSIGGDEIG
jgi:hypothetical protein